MTYTHISSLLKNYQILAPIPDHHLEVTVKITHYSSYRYKKFYFPVDSYSPKIVSEAIDDMALEDSYESHYRVDYAVTSHRYIPIFNKNQSIPDLKEGEEYLVSSLFPSFFEHIYYFGEEYYSSVDDLKNYLNKYPNDHILSIQAVIKPEIDWREPF